ncbi:MAG: HisS family protein [Patescibacteria group bacterium]|jgi:histidyl-tRNA synthetase
MEILPQDQKYWKHITDILETRAHKFGFHRFDTPLILSREVVEKIPSLDPAVSVDSLSRVKTSSEMDDALDMFLQADGTASLINSYYNHYQTEDALKSAKLYQIGFGFKNNSHLPNYFFNAELIGDDQPTSDALLILFTWQILNNLNLDKDFSIELNSVGCAECHPKIIKQLENHYFENKDGLCPNCQSLEKKNILNAIYCNSSECNEIKNSAPQIVDLLCKNCIDHLKQLFEYLDELEVPYNLDTHLFRNSACATRTVFDITSPENYIIGRGARHDNLIEKFGSHNMPAIGLELLLEPLVQVIKNNQTKINGKTTDIYIIQLGTHARRKALSLTASLISKGHNVSCALHKDSLSNYLKEAESVGARIALIIGQKEAMNNSAIFRDIEQCSQETIDMTDLDQYITRKLAQDY